MQRITSKSLQIEWQQVIDPTESSRRRLERGQSSYPPINEFNGTPPMPPHQEIRPY